MTQPTELTQKVVVCFTNGGGTHMVGECIGYYACPTIILEGGQCWAAHLTRLATPEEEADFRAREMDPTKGGDGWRWNFPEPPPVATPPAQAAEASEEKVMAAIMELGLHDCSTADVRRMARAAIAAMQAGE